MTLRVSSAHQNTKIRRQCCHGDASLTSRVTCLYHELFDDSMEDVAIVVAVLAVNTEVLYCLGAPGEEGRGTGRGEDEGRGKGGEGRSRGRGEDEGTGRGGRGEREGRRGGTGRGAEGRGGRREGGEKRRGGRQTLVSLQLHTSTPSAHCSTGLCPVVHVDRHTPAGH